MGRQLKKGKELGVSAFLLITIYGIIIIRIGKLVLPHFINLGEESHAYFWVCILLSLINPFLEEIYWRLFLLKVSLLLLRPSKIHMKKSTSPTSATSSFTLPCSVLF